MRLAAFIAALIALPALAAEPKHKAAPEAVLQVAFPNGCPFARHKLPELRVHDAESGKLIASGRAREWTSMSATYAMALPPGHTYALRWAQVGHQAFFAEVSVSAKAQGSVIYKVPYIPRDVAALMAGAHASR